MNPKHVKLAKAVLCSIIFAAFVLSFLFPSPAFWIVPPVLLAVLILAVRRLFPEA